MVYSELSRVKSLGRLAANKLAGEGPAGFEVVAEHLAIDYLEPMFRSNDQEPMISSPIHRSEFTSPVRNGAAENANPPQEQSAMRRVAQIM